MPGTQFKQTLAALAATEVEYVPALQLLHVAAPLKLYDPALQLTQTFDDVPADIVEYVPALHATHAADEAPPLVVE